MSQPYVSRSHTTSSETDLMIFNQRIQNEIYSNEHDAGSLSSLSLPVLAEHFNTVATFLSSPPSGHSSDLHAIVTQLNSQLQATLNTHHTDEVNVHKWLGQILHTATTPLIVPSQRQDSQWHEHNSHMLLLSNELFLTTQYISEYINISIYGSTQTTATATPTDSYVNLLDDDEPVAPLSSANYPAVPMMDTDACQLINSLKDVTLAPLSHGDRQYDEHMRQEILLILSRLSDRLRQK